MQGLILAAGRGSRMAGLTETMPKCLLPLAGRSLLSYQFAALRGAGIGPIAIATGYRADLLAGRADRAFHNPRWAKTNMVESLRGAGAWLAAAPTVIGYGDIVYGADAVADLAAAPGEIAIAFDPNWRRLWQRRFADPLSDAETFRRAADGRLLEIGARARSLDRIEGQYMGLFRLSPAGWSAIERHVLSLPAPARDRLDMTALLAALIARDVPIETVPIRGDWAEADSADDLALYERMIAAGELVLEPARGDAADASALSRNFTSCDE